MRHYFLHALLAFATLVPVSARTTGGWKRANAPVMTPWGEKTNPKKVWTEYPRPQMEREEWMSLNGLWDFRKEKGTSLDYAPFDAGSAREILVPFPVESALSGIRDTNFVDNTRSTFVYHRTFRLPPSYKDRKILLHFGAVDWKCAVYVNGQPAGSHSGGSDPFHMDITPLLRPEGQQELTIRVTDPTQTGGQPTGKQTTHPAGCFYTPVSGIWQTVWLEPVSPAHLQDYHVASDIDQGTIALSLSSSSPTATATVSVMSEGKTVARLTGLDANASHDIRIPAPRLWSPDSPHLYDLEILLYDHGVQTDKVKGYFGMRKISKGMADGHPCLMLNNRPLYQFGVLDQGWWPDGLLTPPSDDAMRHDIETMKSLGMNMIRKHIKVEPARWYYHCDKMGMLVWQDMPNGGENGTIGDKYVIQQNFYDECTRIVNALDCHPCIVAWVAYNEGWGQDASGNDLHTRRGVEAIRKADPTRLVNAASGWVDFEAGDFIDQHSYPVPSLQDNPLNERVAVCGEYGGITLKVEGHLWKGNEQEYTSVPDSKALAERFISYTSALQDLQPKGLWASVYTQVSDVEQELNGLLTYDRKVFKIAPEDRAAIREEILRTIRYRCHTSDGPQGRTYLPVEDLHVAPLPERPALPEPHPADSVYLMAYFKAGSQHLFYAYSRDGKTWTDLNGTRPVFAAYDNGIWLRDPYLQRVTRNGKSRFHLVHTWGWDHPAIFHWESDDLIHWTAANGSTRTEDGKVMLMDGSKGGPQSPNAWAPEFTYDETADIFYLYWSSRIGDRQVHHYCTTRDWLEFSTPAVYFDPGFTAIDMTILKAGGTYYAYYKDERNGEKTIRCATSKSLDPNVQRFEGDTPILPSRYIEVEGPEVFPALGGKSWFLYFDKFNGDRGTSFARCADPSRHQWYPVPDGEIRNPTDVKHGSVVIISEKELERLQEHYR